MNDENCMHRLSEQLKSRLHIAVIDDGVNEGYFKLGELENNIEITADQDINPRTGYDPFMLSHGSVCAAIIRKYLPDFRLSSIKILDQDMKGMASHLSKAIYWCADNDVDLINLSLGTIDYRDFEDIRNAVDYSFRKGLIIVAACSNRNIYTCPASFSKVIGVCSERGLNLREGEYIYDMYSAKGVEITAVGRHRLYDYKGKVYETPAQNSYAAPGITAIVGSMLQRGLDKNLAAIRSELLKNSCKNNTLKQAPGNSVYGPRDNCQKSIDVPVIVVWDYISEDCLLERELLYCFRKDGYNAVLITDKPVAAVDGDGVIKVGEDCSVENNTTGYTSVYNAYDPDLMILGLSTSDRDLNITDTFRRLEVDINIIHCGNLPGKWCERLFENAEAMNFVISAWDNIDISDEKNIRVISSFDVNRIELLYSSLLELFEKSDLVE